MTFTAGQLNRRAELYHQMGSMVTAGVPLIQALQMSTNNASMRSSHKTIQALIGHLQNGLTFSDSMTRVQGWLPEFDVALLSAGEYSGKLDTTFKLLSNYYSMRASLIRENFWAMLRTAATLHVFLVIFPLGYFIGLAMGIMNSNYTQCVPFFIEKIIVFGALYGIVFFLIFACQGRRGEGWRRVLEAVTQGVPVLGTAQKYLVLSRLSASLEALVSAGYSIIKAWPLAAAASGSPQLKRQVATWGPELERGQTPAELVGRTSYFPEMFSNLYHTGEISGKLDESLNRMQVYYRDEGFLKMRIFARILNGVVYGLVAAFVAYYVVSFYVHYFNAAVNV